MSIYGDDSEASDLVFEHITDAVESVQRYVPGGLHPIHLGDILGDARYKILRKLGYGSYSTVWLAQDISEHGTFVALKIARADSDHAKEGQIHEVLQAKADQHSGSAFITTLKDHFTISGPNGNHDCLVYEIMGPSIAHIRDEYPVMDDATYLTLPLIRRIVYQTLLGLDYMHSVGVIHGDLYASNVLFAVRDLSREPTQAVCQSYGDISIGVQRLAGPRQPGDPRHLTLNRPLNQFILPTSEVKLADLGNSFFEKDPPSTLETPPEMRSPELIVHGEISSAQDCWAFGLLVYNVLTNCYPFDLGFQYSEDSRNDTHLIQLSALLGPPPTSIKNSWPRYHSYFDDQDRLENFRPEANSDAVDDDSDTEEASSYTGSDDLPEDGCPGTAPEVLCDGSAQSIHGSSFAGPLSYQERVKAFLSSDTRCSIIRTFKHKPSRSQESPKTLAEYRALYPPLKERWLAEKHPDMEPEESEVVLDFLQGLFVYDPEQRLSTKDLLQHAWIRDYCAPGNEGGNTLEQETTALQRKRKYQGMDGESLQGRKKGTA